MKKPINLGDTYPSIKFMITTIIIELIIFIILFGKTN